MVGSVFLGDVEARMVRVENTFGDLPTRDRHRLAASRVQDFLAMEVPPSQWSTWEGFGIDPAHSPDVEGQPHLGQSTHPRRIGKAGPAGFDSHNPEVSPQDQAPVFTKLANLSPEPCGWYCGDGFLCGSDGDRSSALRVDRPEP